jgi:hypothetical protein
MIIIIREILMFKNLNVSTNLVSDNKSVVYFLILNQKR